MDAGPYACFPSLHKDGSEKPQGTTAGRGEGQGGQGRNRIPVARLALLVLGLNFGKEGRLFCDSDSVAAPLAAETPQQPGSCPHEGPVLVLQPSCSR